MPSFPFWLFLLPAVTILCMAPSQFTRFQIPKQAVLWLLLWGVVLFGRQSLVVSWRKMWGWWLWLGYCALSLSWSLAPGRGELSFWMWGAAGLWGLMLGSHTPSKPRLRADFRRRFWWGLIGTGLLCAGLALFQAHFGLWRLGVHQVTGSIGNPNRVAGLILLLLPAAWWLRKTARTSLDTIIANLAVLSFLGTLYVTRCRSAWVAVAAMGLFWCWPRQRSRRWQSGAALVLCLLLGVGLASPSVRAWGHKSLRGRRVVLSLSTKVWWQRPLHGHGLGSYPIVIAKEQSRWLSRRAGTWTNLRDPHNQLLAILVATGLVGLLLFGIALGPLFWRMWKKRDDMFARAALTAWLGLGLHALVETPFLSISTVLVALAWLPWRGTDEKSASTDEQPAADEAELPARPRSRVFIGILLIAFATSGLLRIGAHAYADFQMGQGMQLARSSSAADHQAAILHFSRSLRYTLTPAIPQLARGLSLRELQQWTLAAADLERSFVLLPTPERALALGDVLVAQHKLREAVPWYKRAISLHPRYARAYNNLGVAYLRMGQRAQARRYLRRALSLRPGDKKIRRNWRLLRSSSR